MDQSQKPDQAATPITPPVQAPNSNQPAPQTLAEDKFFVIGKYKVKVSRHECIGAASCIAVSPDTFKLDGESKAVVIEQSTDTPDNILLAAQSCPTKAIIITNAETGEQVWPA